MLLNLNNNRSKPKLLRLLWDIIVFKLVAYLLNMTCLNLLLLCKILYVPIFYELDTVDYPFLARVSINSKVT